MQRQFSMALNENLILFPCRLDVCVDSHHRRSPSVVEDKVGGLRPHPVQAEALQDLPGARHGRRVGHTDRHLHVRSGQREQWNVQTLVREGTI